VTTRLADGELLLDGFTREDAPAQLAGEDEEHARRFGWHPRRSTLATVERAIARWQRDWECDGATRAFAARVGQQLVGGCELRRRDNGRWNLAYWVFPPYRRKGYAVRMTRLATAFAFDELRAESVELLIEPDNLASRQVAATTGFTAEGAIREQTAAGVEREMLVYVQHKRPATAIPD
jgi:RimJ/RimL family protein N-acetyltransferase